MEIVIGIISTIIAILCCLTMIVIHFLGIINKPVGEFLWSGEKKVLEKKTKKFSWILIIDLLIMIPIFSLIGFGVLKNSPLEAVIWIELIIFGYYVVLSYGNEKKSKLFNMIWGVIFCLAMMYLGVG